MLTSLPGVSQVALGKVQPRDPFCRQGNGVLMLTHMASTKYRNKNSNPGLLDSKDQKESISLHSACVLVLSGRSGGEEERCRLAVLWDGWAELDI